MALDSAFAEVEFKCSFGVFSFFIQALNTRKATAESEV